MRQSGRVGSLQGLHPGKHRVTECDKIKGDEVEEIKTILQQERHRTDTAISEVAKHVTSTVLQGNRDLGKSINALLDKITDVQKQQASMESRVESMETKCSVSPHERKESSRPATCETRKQATVDFTPSTSGMYKRDRNDPEIGFRLQPQVNNMEGSAHSSQGRRVSDNPESSWYGNRDIPTGTSMPVNNKESDILDHPSVFSTRWYIYAR